MHFKNFKIKMKIIIIVILAILISIAAVGGYCLTHTLVQAQEDIAAFEKELMDETRQKLIDLVNTVYTMVVKVHSQAVRTEDIKKRYGAELKNLVDVPYSIMNRAYTQARKASADIDGMDGQRMETVKKRSRPKLKRCAMKTATISGSMTHTPKWFCIRRYRP